MRSSSRRIITGAVLVLTVCLLAPAWADKLDDFKAAAGKSGCETIPYSSEKNTCKKKQEHKNKVCTNFGCNLTRAEKLLAELTQKRKSLAEARSRNNQSAIPALEKHIQDIEERLQELKAEAEEKIARGDACIQAREDVQQVFSEVKTKVQAEKDPTLKPYIDKLVAHYDEGAEKHKQAFTDVKTARDNCKKVSAIRW